MIELGGKHVVEFVDASDPLSINTSYPMNFCRYSFLLLIFRSLSSLSESVSDFTSLHRLHSC